MCSVEHAAEITTLHVFNLSHNRKCNYVHPDVNIIRAYATHVSKTHGFHGKVVKRVHLNSIF